jgi:hypothetical protein
VDEGKIGEIVAKVQRLIVRYYQDVQNQAMQSFNLARFVAIVGFGVLILTLLYKLVIDLFFKPIQSDLQCLVLGLALARSGWRVVS